MIDQFTNAIAAADNAGATIMLTMVIAIGILLMFFIARQGLPILQTLANGIQQRIDQNNKSIDDNNKALALIKEEVVKESKVNSANASAVAGVADTLSQVSAGQTDIAATMVKLNGALETQSEHFARSVDVLANIYDRIGTQSTQLDILIGTTGATKRTADDTQVSVARIQESIVNGVAALGDITKLLTEIKGQPSALSSNLETLMNTAIAEIREVRNTMSQVYAMPFDKNELPIKEGEAQSEPI